eukprot:Amastigsp_a677343_53.p5 type:complete len:103 gc:universal Amastigsp_a677343_53:944-1252(+)
MMAARRSYANSALYWRTSSSAAATARSQHLPRVSEVTASSRSATLRSRDDCAGYDICGASETGRSEKSSRSAIASMAKPASAGDLGDAAPPGPRWIEMSSNA